MKKILALSLFFITVISVYFWAGSIQAAETNCGNLSYSNGYYMGSFSAGQSKSYYCSGSPEGGRSYYFYLPSSQEVTITLTYGTGGYPKFALYAYEGGSGEDWPGVTNSLYFSKTDITDTLSSGYYTITIYGGITSTNFTLTVSTGGSGSYCGDGHCDSGETCSNCSSDCGKCNGVSCTSASQCQGGYCVNGKCRSKSTHCGDGHCDSGETCSNCSSDCGVCGPVCGDGSCDSGENCSNCKKDCACTAGGCCLGFLESGDLIPKSRNTKGCVMNYDSGVYKKGSGYEYSYICCDGKEENAGPTVVENFGKGPDCCFNTDCPEGECVTNFCQYEKEIPEQTQSLINEYQGLIAEIYHLNNKIDVEEVNKLQVSPYDMHIAIQGLVEDLIEQEKTDKADALLKNTIAAEKLALATYNGEAEMAQMLAESSWQSFRVYLFHKLELIMSTQIDKFFGELTEEEKNLAEKIKSDYEEVQKPEEVLEELGFENTAEIVGAINQAYNHAQGNATKYLENIENQVKQLYIDAYVKMFNENFKYAISNQLVYYQVSAWHHTEHISKIPNSDIPYNEYQTAIEDIKKEIEEEKQYIKGNNVFTKVAELNEKIKEGTGAMDKILFQLGAMAIAVDKGASLAGRETNLGDAVDSLGKLNESLKSAVAFATEVLELPSKLAESLYGTYKGAKLYSVFFNTYDRWYDKCLGGSVVKIRIPLTNYKVDFTWVDKNISTPLLGMADQVLVTASGAVNYLTDGAKAVADAGVEMIKDVGETIDTTIEEGKKMTQKLISAGKSFVYGIRWPGTIIELALISPSGLRFPGQLYDDGLGVYAVINEPEVGEWTAEIFGKEVEGEQSIEIITSAEAKDLGELESEEIEEIEEIEEVPFLKFGIIAAVIIVLILAVVFLWRFKKWPKAILAVIILIIISVGIYFVYKVIAEQGVPPEETLSEETQPEDKQTEETQPEETLSEDKQAEDTQPEVKQLSEIEDLGVVTSHDAPHTWQVSLPTNFKKVEVAHYSKDKPSIIKKYMGWNGYLKVNDKLIWEFKSWSSETGGLIYDATLDKEVTEAGGSNLWIDATSFFKAGSNTVTFYHYTGGDGIGLRIKVTTELSLEMEQMFEAARAYIKKYSAEGMEVDLRIIRQIDNWALLEAIPITIETDSVSVVMEKVEGRWETRDFGTILPGWKEEVPELFPL